MLLHTTDCVMNGRRARHCGRLQHQAVVSTRCTPTLYPGVRVPRAVHQGSSEVVDPVTQLEHVAQQCPLRVPMKLPQPRMNPVEDFYMTWFQPRKWVDRTFGDGPFSVGRMLGVQPSVMIGSADVARELLSYEARGSVTPGWPQSFVSLIGSESVICVTDPVKHRYLRQLLAPALSQEAVAEYLDEIHTICKGTLEEMYNTKGAPALAYPVVKAMTLKVIASVVLNLQLNQEEFKELARDFATFLKNILSVLPIDRWPFSFRESMNARRRIAARLQEQVSIVRRQIATRSGTSQSGGPAAKPLSSRSTLRKLLTAKDEVGNSLTDKQVIDNLVLMMFAGHDTSTVQLVRLLYELALYPKVLARVREEQLQVIARHGPRMTPAALKDMKYTQAVLSEVMRRCPPATGFVRQAREDVVVQGHLIPAKMPAVVSLLGTLALDARWPARGNPDENPLHPANFNPDRFLTEEGAKQGDQVPFGIGAHSCAGQALAQAEAKVFLATLARSYTLLADTNTYWLESSMPRPANDLPVLLDKL